MRKLVAGLAATAILMLPSAASAAEGSAIQSEAPSDVPNCYVWWETYTITVDWVGTGPEIRKEGNLAAGVVCD